MRDALRIAILCSDQRHPIFSRIAEWAEANHGRARIQVATNKAELSGGDILFLISCAEILTEADRAKFRHNFVIHASDLPRRRGWSPHVWAILDGERDIVVSLLAVQDPVDTGDIFQQVRFTVSPDQLLTEINDALFAAEFALMDWALANVDAYQPREQVGEPSYCRKRTPTDSEIDPARPIAEQFDILRLADSIRFPAYFDLHGSRYVVTLYKLESPCNAN